MRYRKTFVYILGIDKFSVLYIYNTSTYDIDGTVTYNIRVKCER